MKRFIEIMRKPVVVTGVQIVLLTLLAGFGFANEGGRGNAAGALHGAVHVAVAQLPVDAGDDVGGVFHQGPDLLRASSLVCFEPLALRDIAQEALVATVGQAHDADVGEEDRTIATHHVAFH